GHRWRRSAVRRAIINRRAYLLVLHRHARERDRLAVQQQPRRGWVDLDPAQPERVVEAVDDDAVDSEVHAQDIQRGASDAPPVRARKDKAPVPDEHGAAAEGEVVDGERGDRRGSGGEEAGRVRVSQVGAYTGW